MASLRPLATRIFTRSLEASTPTELLNKEPYDRWVVLMVASGASLPSISVSSLSASAQGGILRDTTTAFRLARDTPLWIFSGSATTVSVIATDLPDGA